MEHGRGTLYPPVPQGYRSAVSDPDRPESDALTLSRRRFLIGGGAAAAVSGATPLAQNGYKVAIGRAVVRRTILAAVGAPS